MKQKKKNTDEIVDDCFKKLIMKKIWKKRIGGVTDGC